MTPEPSIRVGLVGARRVRQGLGPFVARDLVRLGAEVAVVLGTSEATAKEAASQIERTAGVRPRATADADAFDAEALDAVCVLTPAGTHGTFVERALAAGRHVLCEKPFLWPPASETARALEERFAAAGLVLAVNAQWPRALGAFEEATGVRVDGARRLAMGLAPASEGEVMLRDALPHPISVAQAIAPDLGSVEDVRFARGGPSELRIDATLVGEGARLHLHVELDGTTEATPRSAWLEIDGARADRCVRVRDYAMFLRSGSRLVDLPDPMTAHLGAFVEAVRGSDGRPRAVDRTVSRRAAMLEDFARAYAREFPE